MVRRMVAEQYVRAFGPLTPKQMEELWHERSDRKIPSESWKHSMRSCQMLVEDDSGRFHLKGDSDGA